MDHSKKHFEAINFTEDPKGITLDDLKQKAKYDFKMIIEKKVKGSKDKVTEQTA